MCVYTVGSKEEMNRKMTECLTEELDLPTQNQPPVPPPSTSSTEPDAPLPLESELDRSQPSSSFVAPLKTKKGKISGKYAQSGMDKCNCLW